MLSNTTIATLMASLDINIVLIALPTIGRNLADTSLLDLLWVLLGYQLVISAVVVNFGRLSDIFGRVKLYNLGFIIFTIGSALCGLSQNGIELVVFRMVQGTGGAFLLSNSGAIITDTFPIQERGKALGINRVTQIVGATLGLVLGGFLITIGGWQAIFWINVPIGVFGAVWSHYKLRELGEIERGQRIDLPGNITFAAFLVMLLAAVSLYALGSLAFSAFILLICGSVISFVAFIMIERRVKDPMLDLSLFKIRPFTGGTSASLLNSLARGSVLLVMTFYLQGPTMSLDPFVAGIFLLPNAISMTFWGPISGWLSDRGNTRFYTTLGLLLTFVGFLVLAQLGPVSDFLEVAIPLIFIGSGQGIFASPNRASVMSAVPPGYRGVGSAVNTTMVNVGNTFSRALSFLIMGLVIPSTQIQNIFAGSVNPSSGGPEFITNFMNSIHLVFYVCASFMIISIVPSILRGSIPGRLQSVEGEIVSHEEGKAEEEEEREKQKEEEEEAKVDRGG